MSFALVLAGAGDGGAQAVAACLVGRLGRQRVAFVTDQQLACAAWSHTIERGCATTTVRLAGGGVIVPSRFGVVLNRLPALSALAFGPATEADRAYAEAEMQALFVSFLAGFGDRLCNPVDGLGPAGQWHQLRWRVLAERCGLVPAPLWMSTSTRRSPLPVALPDQHRGATGPERPVLVAGRHVVGAASCGEELACRRLAQAAGCSLLEVRLAGDPAAVIGVDVFPPLADVRAEVVAAMLCERLHAASSREGGTGR